MEQLLRHGGDRAGRSGVAGNAKQSLKAITYEPAEPQKTAADQVDGGQTRGQAKTLFGQPGDSTR